MLRKPSQIARPAVFAAVLTMSVVAGCDMFLGNDTISGRVVDVVTGDAPTPGTVRLSLYRCPWWCGLEELLSETETDIHGRFVLDNARDADRMRVAPSGRIDYPAAAPTDSLPFSPDASAYFAIISREPGGGTISLEPTALLVITVSIDRPLDAEQQIEIRASPPDWPDHFTARLGRFYGPLPAGNQRLLALARGSRPTQVAWSVRRRGVVEASGRTQVTCPRHAECEVELAVAVPP
jgi:hypothetical protein